MNSCGYSQNTHKSCASQALLYTYKEGLGVLIKQLVKNEIMYLEKL